MQIFKCDRCGKEIIYHPAQQTILPKYAISAMYSASDIRMIDLCDKCQQNLTEWLHGENIKADVLDKMIAEIEEIETCDGIYIDRAYVLEILDKYKAESEVKE